MKIVWGVVLFLFILTGCASKKFFESEQAQEILENKEYDEVVKVKVIAPPAKKEEPKPEVKEEKPASKKTVKTPKKKAPVKTKKPAPQKITKKTKIKRHYPKLEDSEGFDGRRPIIDPFVVGEKVTFDMKYFNMAAGEMTMQVMPMVEVNGRKAYHFRMTLKSSKMFSYVYEIDDYADTYVDYETLKPYTLDIKVKESKQLKDIRSFFDWKKLVATMWIKRITEEKGVEKKKINWKIKNFSQNVISAPFYLRTFTLKPNKQLAFRVADEGKNLVFTGEVLRKEKLKTKAGTFDTVVIKPKITVDGLFKQMGEIYMWMTDDHYKTIVRIEAKIKVGTVVGSLRSLER